MARRSREDLTLAATLADLPDDGCKWAVGPQIADGESAHAQLFCGQPKEAGCAFCTPHANKAWPDRHLKSGKGVR